MGDQHPSDLSARYVRFADDEVRGRSPLYERFVRGVADDQDAIRFLMSLPKEKRQPNLLLAAMRHQFGILEDWAHFRAALLANAEAIRCVMLTHSTQTNEPARCATLLPLLALLPPPLALIEVGASAGLCLLPDFYGYDFGRRQIRPALVAEAPVFTCSVNEATPLPVAMPRIVWRAGLDLNPLGAADPAQSAWLETLVWPEQTRRLENLRAALQIATVHQPRIVKGDLLGDGLAELCRQVPGEATLVVFHTAVLGYVARAAERRRFAERVQSLCHYWISNEAPEVFADVASRVDRTGERGRFLMSVNDSPVAWSDPHGATLEWIAVEGWRPDRPAGGP